MRICNMYIHIFVFHSLGGVTRLQHDVSFRCPCHFPRRALWKPNSRHHWIVYLSLRPSRQLLCNNASTSLCDLWRSLGTGNKPWLIPLDCDSYKVLQKAPGPCFGDSSGRCGVWDPCLWPCNTVSNIEIRHRSNISDSCLCPKCYVSLRLDFPASGFGRRENYTQRHKETREA